MQSALLVVAIGGGDAKIPATALIGYRELIDFLFLMSLCGGALAPKIAVEIF